MIPKKQDNLVSSMQTLSSRLFGSSTGKVFEYTLTVFWGNVKVK
ncbi:MAG TPA: hypothetical protein PLO93_04480 [Candidatus Omnitrophota bacterium]|nr:hypothetical protein [Candidatus Omnitrophota bacterium]HQL41534.1 hypothetical protein [Candidatus Omnitrophota bacterium]